MLKATSESCAVNLSKPNRETIQAVLPGDKLGVVEEFLPGPGTYEHEGTIYSNFIGQAKIDMRNKRVTVLATTRILKIPREGSTVIASVTHTHEKLASVSIWKLDGNTLQKPFGAMLHISSSSPRYERNMSDVCKAGDIIRARVIDMTNGTPDLTTAGRGLGVIKAFCSKCGGELLFTNSRLQCSSCENVERRRFAEDYGRST